MAPSSTKVIVVHVIGAKATNVVSAKTSDVIAAKATYVASAKAAHVGSAKAADVATAKATHVASAKAAHVATAKATHVASAKATHVATATAATAATAAPAAGLCTRGNKAASKQCACQNNHCSSSHNILHLDGRSLRHRASSDVGAFQQGKRQRRDGLEMGMAILPLH